MGNSLTLWQTLLNESGFALFTDWQSIYFAQSWVFWLFAVGIVWLIWYSVRPAASDWDAASQSKQFIFRHPLIHLLNWQAAPIRQANGWRWMLQGIRLIILSLLMGVLAQPTRVVQLPPDAQTKTVRDIVFVVESSVSFLLPDYQMSGHSVTRMQVVKTVLDRFMAGLQGNRFGLVLFADNAYTLMPLTADAQAARLMLKRLKPYLAGRNDAAMGEALGLALQQTEQTTATTKNRIVVLISDGSTFPSRLPLRDVIGYAQSMNVPIYTIGVGAGSAKADKRVYTGLLYQPLESASLQRLAKETNGRYYQIGSDQDLQQVLSKINQVEGVAFKEPQTKTQKVALYPPILGLAIFLLVLYLILVQILSQRLTEQEGTL